MVVLTHAWAGVGPQPPGVVPPDILEAVRMHIGGDFVHIEVAFQYEVGLLEVQQHILGVGMPWEVDRHQGVELQALSLVVLVLGVLHSSVGVQVAEQLELMGVDLGVELVLLDLEAGVAYEVVIWSELLELGVVLMMVWDELWV